MTSHSIEGLSDGGLDLLVLAEAVHRGRFPSDREPTPFGELGIGETAYCYRIAKSVQQALSAAPERVGGGGMDSSSQSQRGRNGIIQRPPIERLRAMLAIDPVSGCHVWQGQPDQKGYARIALGGHRNRLAHRLMYESEVGPIPHGMTIDHLCRNKLCCNARHLELVTFAENSRRAWDGRERPTACKKGHPFGPGNNYRDPKAGTRRCLVCQQEGISRRRKLAEKGPQPFSHDAPLSDGKGE